MYKLIQWHSVDDKVLNDITKYTVLKENVTTPSVIGLSPNLEYFKVVTPFIEPEHDVRLVFITVTHTMTETLIEGFRSWEITFAITERTADEKKVSVDEKEAEVNFNIIANNKQLKYLALYAVITNRRVQGLTITDKMLELESLVEAKALKIWENHITAGLKKELIDADNPVNIDDEWQTGEI